jgi:hypothetical protein
MFVFILASCLIFLNLSLNNNYAFSPYEVISTLKLDIDYTFL